MMGLLPKPNDRCEKCGQAWRRLVALTLLGDLVGAKVRDQGDCLQGGDHKWPEEDEEAA